MNSIIKTGALALLASVTLSTTVLAADAEKGRQAFATNGCWSCHGYEGQGGASGPKLAPNPPALAGMKIFVRTNQTDMPAYSAKVLSDATIEDMHAFLSSIKAPNPDSIPLLRD